MYRLIIFDFDDTLLHLDIDWQAVKADVIALARSANAEADEKKHLVAIGNALSEKAGLKSAIDAIYLRHEMLCAERRAYSPFPEMLALAGELRQNGRKIAIASGNHTESISRILSDLGAISKFDFICGRDLVARNKPAPDQLLLILDKLKARKQDTLFAGDSLNDRQAANRAGVDYFETHPDSKTDLAHLRRVLISP